MATSQDFIEFVCGQISGVGAIRYRKMFGECMIYINEKPILLLCDNTVYIKMHPSLESLCADCDKDIPYEGAKEHYVIDVENMDFAKQVISTLEPLTPLPKPKKKK